MIKVVHMKGCSVVVLSLLAVTPQALASLYSYQNEAGDYVISQTKPKGVAEYAVLTDDGEFVRLVRKQENVPISHWRPWYLPREPDPFKGPDIDLREQAPSVEVEEIDEADSQ